MAERDREWNDTRVESVIGTLLRVGVILSASLVALGGTWYLIGQGSGGFSYGAFRGEPPRYRSVSGVLLGLRSLDGRGVIQLGLLLLIATPVVRVAFAAWAFAKERDWTYVGITLIVLIVLTYSLAGSH